MATATMQASSAAASDEQGEGNDDGVAGGIDLTFGREYTEAALWELEWLPYLIRLALARSPGAFALIVDCVWGLFALVDGLRDGSMCCVRWWSVVWMTGPTGR